MSGGEVALLNLVTRLDRRRYEPIVILLSDGPLRERLIAADVDVRIVPLDSAVGEARKDSLGKIRNFLQLRSIIAFASCLKKIVRVVRESSPAIVHTNSLKADILGGLAARWVGVPVVWHVRDRIADDYLPPRVAKIFRWLCGLVPDRVIANSHATLQTLGSHVNGNAKVVHDGTMLPALNFSPADSREPLIGLVGRFARWKGQHIFIDAAAIVLRKFPRAKFQLIGAAMFGEDDYGRQLHEQVDRLGVAASVEFRGHCDDAHDLIMQLDILAHASITGEPFGQVLIEGMAAGKPVVATNGGGVPEIVIDGATGVLVPMGDAAAMASAICSLLADADQCRRMGDAGRVRRRATFHARTCRGNVEQIYEEMLDG